MAALDVKTDVVVHEGGKLGRRIMARRALLLPAFDQRGHMRQHQIEKQIFLGGEVTVERCRLHAHFRCELAHRHSFVAVMRDQADGRFADRGLRLLAVGTGRSCHEASLSGIMKRTFN